MGIFAAGWDNLLQLYSFPLTVGSIVVSASRFARAQCMQSA